MRLTDDELRDLHRNTISIGVSGGERNFNQVGIEMVEMALEELIERRKKDKEQGPV